MDREDYFKIMENLCCYNLDNYIRDRDWTCQSYLSHVIRKEEKDELSELLGNPPDAQTNVTAFPYLDPEDTQMSEKIKKENYSKRTENSYDFASNANQLLEDYHERKILLFEKIVNSHASSRIKYNKLQYHSNHIAEKFAFKNSSFESTAGLDPSKWPDGMEDLLAKLPTLEFEELFYQQFDVDGQFHRSCLEFISTKFSQLLESPSDETIQEVLVKSMHILLTMKIMEGNFTKFCLMLKGLHENYAKNKSVFNEIFHKALLYNHAENPNTSLIGRINSLMDILKENNGQTYPIMRNYSILDYFNVSKNILFASQRSDRAYSTVATDSSYLFITLSGISGGMLKVGTGNGNTTKGKVYAYSKNYASKANPQLVYLKNKLFFKTSAEQLDNSLGTLLVINPENLKGEVYKKLQLPESAKHPSVKKRNEQFVILSDEENLYVLILEPVITEKKNEEKFDIKAFDPSTLKKKSLLNEFSSYGNYSGLMSRNADTYSKDIVTHINLILYTFPTEKKIINHNQDDPTQVEMIDELFESFSRMFKKEQCRRALEKKKWNMEKAASYLIKIAGMAIEDERLEVIEPISRMVVFETRVEPTMDREGRLDYSMVPNSPFDSTKFDSLKWALVKDKLIGYKFKEGACVMFSKDPSNEKEFKYSYPEKLGRLDYIPVDYSHAWEANKYQYNPDLFLLDQKVAQDKIKEAEELEKVAKLKELLKSLYDIPPEVEAELLELSEKSRNLLLEDFLAKEGTYVRDEFLYQIDSLKDTELKPKEEDIKNVIHDAENDLIIHKKKSVDMLDNNNNFIVEEKSSKGSKDEEGSYDEKNVLEKIISDSADNEKFDQLVLREEKNLSNTSKKDVKSILHAWLDSTKKKDELKVLSQDDLVLPQRSQKDSSLKFSPNEEIPHQDLNKKIIKTKRKYIKDKEGPAHWGKVDEKFIPPKEKMIDDMVKGTLIKILPSINSLTLLRTENTFCYDLVNKVYYIISGALVSISVFVSTTFEEKSEYLRNMLHECTNVTCEQLYNYLSTITQSADLDYDVFSQNMLTVITYLNTRQPDINWRYKNWNFFYTNLLSRDNLGEDQRSSYEYPHRLFPQTRMEKDSIKTFENQLKQTAEFNEKALKDQLPQDLANNLTIEMRTHANGDSNQLQSLGPSLMNIASQSWGSWYNDSYLLLEGDYEKSPYYETLVNSYIYIDNRRQFFHCIDGEESSLEMILENLSGGLSMKEYSQVHLWLVLGYLWMESVNHVSFAEMRGKLENTGLREQMGIFNSLLKDILMLKDHANLISLAYKILISGWEVLCTDLESQIEWFYKLYSNYPSCSQPLLSQYLERNILRIGDANSSFTPFDVLLQKFSLKSSLALVYNFNRIHCVKTYFITSIPDFAQKDTPNKKKLVLIPKTYSINPKNVCYPFYWLFIGANMLTYKMNDIGMESKATKEEDDLFPNDLYYGTDSLFKYGSKEEFEQMILYKERKKFELLTKGKKPEKDVYEKLIGRCVLRKTVDRYIISRNCVNNNEGYLRQMSEEFWKFISERIMNDDDKSSSQVFLNMLSDFFIFCVGDLHEYASFNIEDTFMKNNELYTRNPVNHVHIYSQSQYYKSYTDFINRNLDFALKLLQSPDKFDQLPVQSYVISVMNTIYSKIKLSPITILLQLTDKLTHFLNDIVHNPVFTINGSSIFHNLTGISSSGGQIENQKTFDYKVGDEVATIYETIQFPGAASIVVEIEVKQAKEKSFANYDMLIVSKEHSYSNARYIPGNNHKDYGTCFTYKLNRESVKKLFLIGDEIKIISPSEMEFRGYDRFDDYARDKYWKVEKAKPKTNANDNSKSILKIKCYPFNYMTFDGKYMEKADSAVLNWIELVKDADYFNTHIVKKLIRSFEITPDEKELEILKDPIIKLGFAQYELNDKNFDKFTQYQSFNNAQVQAYFDSLSTSGKDRKEELSILDTISQFTFPTEISSEAHALLTELENVILNPNYAIQYGNINKLCIILNKIRDNPNFKEPQSYVEVKRTPSFTNQVQQLWKLVEFTLCLCLIYHLNSDQQEDFDNEQIIFTAIGRRLNSTLNWMSGRLKRMKATHDSTRNYLQDVLDTISSYKSTLLGLMIEKITHDMIETASKVKVEEQAQEVVGDNANVNVNVNVNENENVNVSEPLPDSIATIEQMKKKSLNELIEEYPQVFEEFANSEALKKIIKDTKDKIKGDLNEQYFGNADSLKDICEVNGIPFNETNLHESLKSYTELIFENIHKIIQMEDIKVHIKTEINRDELNKKLYMSSPYMKIPYAILERVYFLMSLNKICATEETFFPCGESLSKTISFSKIRSRNKEDEDKILLPHQAILLKSLCNFLSDETNLSAITSIMNKQHMRFSIRQIGIQSLECLITNLSSVNTFSKVFSHLFGAVSSSVKDDLLYGLDTVPLALCRSLSSINLNSIFSFFFNSFHDLLNLYSVYMKKKDKNVYSLNYILKNLNLIASDLNVLLATNSNIKIDPHLLEKMILDSVKCIFKQDSPAMNKLKLDFLNNIWILVTQLVKAIPSIADVLMECCTEIVETQIVKKEKIEVIEDILEFMHSLAIDVQAKDSLIISNICEKLFDIAILSESHYILKMLCNIAKVMLRSTPTLDKINFTKFYDKLGRLLTFDKSASPMLPQESKYRVVIQMNSQEFEYQFLVNALFQWEEKYPTQLSLYKNDAEFLSYVTTEKYDIENIPNELNTYHNPIITATPQPCEKKNYESAYISGHYLNRLVTKSKKMSVLESIVKTRLDKLRKTYEDVEKEKENEDEQFMKLHKLKIDRAYMYRILNHIKVAEIIGENACSRGYCLLDTVFTREQAEVFAELIHRAEHRLLPKIKTDLETADALFADSVIYPAMPGINDLIQGCTNVLKETTPNFMNITLVDDEVYKNLRSNLLKDRTLSNNNASDSEKVIDTKYISGGSISLIIDDILHLIYNTYDTESKSHEFIHALHSELSAWKSSEKKNYSLLGLLHILSGGYRMLRQDSKVIMNGNPENVYKIVQGGHKTGKSTSHVLLLKDKSGNKIEQVNTSTLEKVEMNSHLLNMISLKDIMEPLINAYAEFRNNPDDIYNRMLVHLFLKLSKQIRISNSEIMSILRDTKDESSKVWRFISCLKSIADEIQWIGGSLTSWEVDFIESFERIYDRMNPNSDIIYSPVFYPSFFSRITSFQDIHKINASTADLITNYILPESAYLSQLPKISDLSKCSTALKNVQNFDRIMVESIINAYRNDKYVDAAANSTLQIRSHLLNGDLKGARDDLINVFGNSGASSFRSIIKEEWDLKEIIKEECFPGNYYLARVTSKFIQESGIQSLQRCVGLGILEIPVLLLLNDSAMGNALVLYCDHEYGKMHSFWIQIESLIFLEHQLKIPSSSFKLDYLITEFCNNEKHLSIIYAKKALLHLIDGLLLTSRKLSSFDELLYHISLSNWEKFKMDPDKGVLNTFRNYILIKHSGKDSDLLLSKNSSSKNYSLPMQSDLLAFAQHEDQSAIVKNTECFTNTFDIEDTIHDAVFTGEASPVLFDKLAEWCISTWKNIHDHFTQIKVDLFNEYNIGINDVNTLRSKNIFQFGNFSMKLLALHELCKLEEGKYSGMVIVFERGAYIGPHAKVSFYTDPYGENLVHEMISIKIKKEDIDAIVFKHPKIWMGYKPGTTIFYNNAWYTQSRNSYLPCCITFIPYNWPTLVYLTDLCSNGPYMNLKIYHDNILSKFILQLFPHCASLTFPVEFQRRIFSIANRIILKASKYFTVIHQQGIIQLDQMPIRSKFTLIGVEPDKLIRLIENISHFNDKLAEKSFSSGYIVEGVEIVLSILSAIKESFTSLSDYLQSAYNYSLPMWIEAIIKLGQILSFLQGYSNLDKNMMNEIDDQLNIDTQFEKLIVITNASNEIPNETIYAEIKRLLTIHNAKVVDMDKDVQIFTNEEGLKTVVILIDGFVIDTLIEESEIVEEKEKAAEDDMWECFYNDCRGLNDKDNTVCVYCERSKKVTKKDPPKKEVRSHLVKIDSYNNTVNEKMKILKTSIGNCLYQNSAVQINIIQGEELNIALSDDTISQMLNRYFKLRLDAYIKEKYYIDQKLSSLEALYTTGEVNSNCQILRQAIANMQSNEIDLVKMYISLQNHGIDFWLEPVILDSLSRNKEIPIVIMEKIRELVDLKICKEKNISLIFPSHNLRFVPAEFHSINHSTSDLLNNNFSDLRSVPLSDTRFYWTIIKYFNNCLVAALPFIRPPDSFSTKDSISSEEDGYIAIHLPKTISAFLATARGITFSHIKNILIQEIVSHSEFNEDLIQIPTFKFERLSVLHNQERRLATKTRRLNKKAILDEEEDDDEAAIFFEEKEDIKADESLFLQAYQQAKGVDPAFFRSQKIEGDHTGFKVEFSEELVQGISGPYRQFFSDISLELQECNEKTKKTLRLLHPTSNKLAERGEFKDKYTITPSYNSPTALCHYEFLGILMGICIRTGVYLPLDLCSIVWKKIIHEQILIDDIKEFDEGLFEQMRSIEKDPAEFEQIFNQAFSILLTDGTAVDLLPDGKNLMVDYDNRFKYMQLALRARLSEADSQIEMIRKGLCKMIPTSLLKLLTYRELERLVCGIKTVDINLLRANTKVSDDLANDSNRVKWLWEILNEFSEDEKVKFVKFCWAQERLPPSQEEYHKRHVMFTIKSNPDKKLKDILPRSDTCFFFLILPEYSSKEIMGRMISQAINLDNVGMNGDFLNQVNHHRNVPDYEESGAGFFSGRGRGRGGYSAFNYVPNEDDFD